MSIDTRAILDRAQNTYCTTNPGNLGRYGAQLLLQDVPEMVTEIKRLRAENAQLRKALEQSSKMGRMDAGR